MDCPCCTKSLRCSNAEFNRHLDLCLSGLPDPDADRFQAATTATATRDPPASPARPLPIATSHRSPSPRRRSPSSPSPFARSPFAPSPVARRGRRTSARTSSASNHRPSMSMSTSTSTPVHQTPTALKPYVLGLGVGAAASHLLSPFLLTRVHHACMHAYIHLYAHLLTHPPNHSPAHSPALQHQQSHQQAVVLGHEAETAQ